MSWKSIFTLTAEEVDLCCKFAEKVSQSSRQFGSAGRREPSQALADCLIGKVCEAATQKFVAHNFNIDIVLDFEFYDGIDNGNDICLVVTEEEEYCHPSFKVDIKSNGKGGRWLLVEGHKYGQEWADAYVMARIQNWPRNPELRAQPAQVKGKPCTIEISGFAYSQDFTDSTSHFWFEFRQGDRLIDPYSVKNRADYALAGDLHEHMEYLRQCGRLRFMAATLDSPLNYGLPISWLRNSLEDWRDLLETIKADLLPVGDMFWEQKQLIGPEAGWLTSTRQAIDFWGISK